MQLFLPTTLAFAGFDTAFTAEDQASRATFTVALKEIDDLKSVYATVHSKDLIEARVRTPGTIASLKVDKGTAVEPGQVMALVTDPKIALKIKALDAQLVAIQSRMETAKTPNSSARKPSKPRALRPSRASIRPRRLTTSRPTS